jgi:hypothetical protein
MRTLKSGLIAIITTGLLAGSAVGVAAQEEAGYFTVTFDGQAFEEPSDFDESGAWFTDIEMAASDPRMAGILTLVSENDVVEVGDDGYGAESSAVRVVNDDGAWSGTADAIFAGNVDRGTQFMSLTGEGGYDGLVAYIVRTTGSGLADTDVWGVILPSGTKPAYPPPIPAE